jgi:hypothetical protein
MISSGTTYNTEEVARADVGSETANKLSFACWLNVSGQSQTCADLSPDQR